MPWDPGIDYEPEKLEEESKIRQKVLENPKGAGENEIVTFFETATDEQKTEFYNAYGINVQRDFIPQIESYVSNTSFTINEEETGILGNSRYYKPEEVKNNITRNLADVESIVNGFIFNDDNGNISFEQYLNTTSGKQKVTDLVKKIDLQNVGDQKVFDAGFGSTGLNATAERISRAQEQAGVPPEPVSEDKLKRLTDEKAKQCVLIQVMHELGVIGRAALKTKLDNNENSLPYGSRIIKANINEPSTFVNYLTSVPGINTNFTELSFKNNKNASQLIANKTKYRLSFIKEYNDYLYELPVYGTLDSFENNILNSRDTTPKTTAPPAVPREDGKRDNNPNQKQEEQNKEEPRVVVVPKNKNIEKDVSDVEFEINYEGTNPSTYRSDVDVSISFYADTMGAFLKSWTYNGITDGEEEIKFNLFDLVLLPILEKDANGYGKFFRSQFSPNYNRIRLTYANSELPPELTDNTGLQEFYSKNVNVLDLTPVDHEIKREEDGKRYQLKINYRGYIHSVLNSPETDVLSDKGIKATRASRDALIARAIRNKCSAEELQKIESQLAILAKNDIEDVSDVLLKNIWNRINSTNGLGIFYIDATNLSDTVRDDNDNISIDKLKSSIIDGSGKVITIDTSDNDEISALQLGEANTTDVNEIINSKEKIYFFYLADLIDAALLNSTLFAGSDPANDPTNNEVMKQQLRFVLSCFKDRDENIINIGDIPISVDFFLKWYEENVTKKELYIYPCASFIRDITETVITNLLNELCFKEEEETKIIVRSAFSTATVEKEGLDYIFKLNQTALLDNKKHILNLDKIDELSKPIFKIDYDKNVVNYVNYCSIYTTEYNKLRARAFDFNVDVPKYKLEYADKTHGATNTNFSRTTQQGFRESRYARNSNSGITMLAGVYNVDLDLTFPIHSIYPNQFFEIDINTPEEGYIEVNGNRRKIFDELGMNGYYAVTKVNTKINTLIKKSTTKVSGLWVSPVDPTKHSTREEEGQTNEIDTDTSQNCETYVNIANEVGVLEVRNNFNLENYIDEQERRAEDELGMEVNIQGNLVNTFDSLTDAIQTADRLDAEEKAGGVTDEDLDEINEFLAEERIGFGGDGE